MLYQLSYTRIVLAERLGVEPSEPLQALQISNLLHYHPAPAPYVFGSTVKGDLAATVQCRVLLASGTVATQ